MTDLVSRLRKRTIPVLKGYRRTADGGYKNEYTQTPDQLCHDAADRIEALERALREARDCVENWGAYAGSYFIEKHGLADDIAAIDAALSGTVAPPAGLVEALANSVTVSKGASEGRWIVEVSFGREGHDAADRFVSACLAALANHRSTPR